jgi:hypothetical protein
MLFSSYLVDSTTILTSRLTVWDHSLKLLFHIPPFFETATRKKEKRGAHCRVKEGGNNTFCKKMGTCTPMEKHKVESTERESITRKGKSTENTVARPRTLPGIVCRVLVYLLNILTMVIL